MKTDNTAGHRRRMTAQELIRKKPVMLDFIAHKLDVYNNRQLAPFGVTHSQAKLLVRISHSQGGKIAQSELKAFGRQGSTITSLLANLEKNGFIYRESSETDARAKYVCLTESGMQVADVANENIIKLDELIDSSLSKKEADTLHSLLAKVCDTLHDRLSDEAFTEERNDNT